ncbi:ferric reductase-like transmembrane domain-containing protein [Sorangium sp. So ce1036]|uniref:ferredoxin reductase family protein n=1 Tax=Sorangium sp. So ce1036 TaxID=3133328 RepID=UPI003EFCB407
MEWGPPRGARVAPLLWIVAGLALPAGLLSLLLVGAAPAGRGLAVEIAAGLGYVALGLLALQLALGARARWIVDAVGLDTVLLFHRQVGLWTAAFAAAHVVLLAFAEPWYVAHLLDLRADAPRALALALALMGLLLLVLVPRQLTRLRIPYEAWRVGHGLLAVTVVGVALWHALALGRSSATPEEQAAMTALVAAPLAVLLGSHLLRPLSALRRPWRVAEVRLERDRVWTLVLEAVGHDGLRFHPGQAVWLTLGRSPLSPRQHPFTVASSAAAPRRVELTIKELGDFTRSIGRTPVGTRAYLAGPYGTSALDLRAPRPLVCVAGGLGVTPMMSMLRTLRDRDDRRPALLVYAAGALDKIVFGPELDELARALDLRVVYVLESPPPGWTGERGLIGGELLDRHLTARYEGAEVFVCGPEPMMNLVERALRDRGVPGARVHAEHFTLVGSRPPGRRSLREQRIRALAAGAAALLLAAVLLVGAVRAAPASSTGPGGASALHAPPAARLSGLAPPGGAQGANRTRPKRRARWKFPSPRMGDHAVPPLFSMA